MTDRDLDLLCGAQDIAPDLGVMDAEVPPAGPTLVLHTVALDCGLAFAQLVPVGHWEGSPALLG